MRMWGDGGRLYWDDKNEDGKGVVVLFGWASVVSVDLLNKFSLLYGSLGWKSLICSPPFLNPFVPDRAASMAFLVLKKLIEVLQLKPCPVVFVSFSGGSRACMYKVIQMLTGTLEAHLKQDDIQMLRNCISGFVYDSGPIDCTSEVGASFALHPVMQKAPGAAKLVSWMAKWFTYGSDALFLTKFESQSNEYWRTLYSSRSLGAPVLFLCSESDDLAPCRVICNFAQCLQDLGGDIELLKWQDSPHLGHYENHTAEYGAAVDTLLRKSASLFFLRIQGFDNSDIRRMDDEIPELISHLRKAAVSSKLKIGALDVSPSDQSFKPQTGVDDRVSSWDSLNPQDEQKEKSNDMASSSTSTTTSTPSISAHSVLGRVLFDACVPKNVEGWDIRFSGCVNGQPFGSARRLSALKSVRGIRRSRL